MKRAAVSAVAALAMSAALCWLAGCQRTEPVSAQEMALYASKISFSHFRMSAAENMAGNAIYDIRALVTNGGDRTIRRLDVKAIFRDLDGMVILQEAAVAVNERREPLGPHQSRDFRMGFEGIPESWNRHAPELQVTNILFE
jgi:hypothetical protein